MSGAAEEVATGAEVWEGEAAGAPSFLTPLNLTSSKAFTRKGVQDSIVHNSKKTKRGYNCIYRVSS